METTSFGTMLRAYRKARDLTQAELAQLVGCAAESIRKMEANKQRPSKQFVQRLADLLALSSEERMLFIQQARTPGSAAQGDVLRQPEEAPVSGASQQSTIAAVLSSIRGVPIRFHSLVGRKPAIAAVCDLLRRSEVGMVTLTGPGGVGKTRLAIQVASELLHEFPDGVYFVSLTAISDPDLVTTTIAQALRIRETDTPLLNDYLKAYLRDKRLLLILDNFEHVIAATSIVAELRNVAPALRLLVTSRALLHLYGEREFVVPPLSLPSLKQLPKPQELLDYESIQLFLERAQLVNPSFTLSEANARAVAEICHRLDGLPLAIELAAARSKLLTPQMMLARLGKRLALLTGGAHDLPVRHQTLRDAIAWSYDLLSPSEQALFRQLGVFAGSWTLDAAETICAGEGIDGQSIELIGSLIDKSLLQHVDSMQGEGLSDERRFAMMETIREYAIDQLEQRGELGQLRQRHLKYYLGLVEQAVPHLAGPHQGAWLARLELDYDNLRAALQWVVDQRDGETALRLYAALLRFWYVFGQPAEIRQWVEALLAMELPPEARAKAQQLHGYVLAFMQSDYAQAEQSYERALELWRRLGNQVEIAHTLCNLGIVAMERGSYDHALQLHEESLGIQLPVDDHDTYVGLLECLGIVLVRRGELARASQVFEECLAHHTDVGEPRAIAFVLHYLGVIAFYQGQHQRARQLLDQALSLWHGAGDTRGVSAALNSLGPVALYQGDAEQSRKFLIKSLTMRWEWQDRDGVAWSLERLAEVAFIQGQDQRAARLWGGAEALRARIGLPLPPIERERHERSQSQAMARCGDAAWRAAWSAGRAMSWDQAVEEALNG